MIRYYCDRCDAEMPGYANANAMHIGPYNSQEIIYLCDNCAKKVKEFINLNDKKV